ncbi:MAG: hypothetical protein ACTHLW_16615 [Verrucomicrobiota bacterium]
MNTPFSRRQFLQTVATTLPAASALATTLKLTAAEVADEKLPPVRAITKGPKFHWRGYYDKLLFSRTNRYVLANQVDFEGRSPKPDDVIQVGMIDLEDGDKWIELGSTHAWNWQQGCMLQWVPGSDDEVLWNDREDGQFVAHILNVKTGKKRTLPHAIYTLSPDGRFGLTTDFRRLNDCRPGYGYGGIPDPNRAVLAPADSGVWKVDLKTGDARLLFTLAEIAAIPWEAAGGYAKDAKSWFNHLLFNQDGSRFIFLHRWSAPTARGLHTRMFTASAEDGSDRFIIDPSGATSHFVWRDPQSVFMFTRHPSAGDRFYVFRDKTREVEVIGRNAMTENGHNTFIPHTNNQWVLNDTYPDKNRLQHPYLYHIPTDRRLPLGHFLSPPAYKDEWRCDNHPCASRDGKYVVIDSPHGGNGRQLYLIDIRGLIG